MNHPDRELVLLTGKPGSGKSRLGKELGKTHSVEHVSFGDTVRRMAGAAISSVYETDVRDHLARTPFEQLPQDVALEIAYEIFIRADGVPTLILDGFPRNPGQVKALSELTHISQRKLVGAIETTVADDTALWRMTGRSEREVTPEEARQRLEAYHASQPDVRRALADTYPHATIDTSGSKDATNELGHRALSALRHGVSIKDLAA